MSSTTMSTDAFVAKQCRLHPFQLLDIDASFGPGSVGREKRRLVADGKVVLDESSWAIVNDAHSHFSVQEEDGTDHPLTHDDVRLLWKWCVQQIREIFPPDLRVEFPDGVIRFAELDIDEMLTLMIEEGRRKRVPARGLEPFVFLQALYRLDLALILFDLEDVGFGMSYLEKSSSGLRALEMSDKARANALQRVKSNPKAAEKNRWKEEIKQAWTDWQLSPGKFKSKKQFIGAMQDRYPNDPPNNEVVAHWTRKWEKSGPAATGTRALKKPKTD